MNNSNRPGRRAKQPNASQPTGLPSRRSNVGHIPRRPVASSAGAGPGSAAGPSSAPGAGHIPRRPSPAVVGPSSVAGPVASPAAPPVADVPDTRGIQGELSSNVGFISEALAVFDVGGAEVERLREVGRAEYDRRANAVSYELQYLPYLGHCGIYSDTVSAFVTILYISLISFSGPKLTPRCVIACR
jgi:hypothetical protein